MQSRMNSPWLKLGVIIEKWGRSGSTRGLEQDSRSPPNSFCPGVFPGKLGLPWPGNRAALRGEHAVSAERAGADAGRQLKAWLEALGAARTDYFMFRRNRLALCALPDDPETFLKTLKLYRPQRALSRAYVWALHLGLHTGLLRRFWPRTPWHPGADATGPTVGILWGNASHGDQRCIFCFREGARWVVGKYSTEARPLAREAELLRAAERFPGSAPRCLRLDSGPRGNILKMEYRDHTSQSPTLRQKVGLLASWLLDSPARPLADFPAGRRLLASPDLPASLRREITNLRLRPALSHGDFAPWNLLVDRGGSVFAVDWEDGEPEDAPGFDLVHDALQREFLVHRRPFPKAQIHIREELNSTTCADYLQACGWGSHLHLLLPLALCLEKGRRPALSSWMRMENLPSP